MSHSDESRNTWDEYDELEGNRILPYQILQITTLCVPVLLLKVPLWNSKIVKQVLKQLQGTF